MSEIETMNITLKNIQKCHGSDGEAFSADIYLDDAKVGSVSNAGRGGCNDYQMPYQMQRKLSEYADSVMKQDFENLDALIDRIRFEMQVQIMADKNLKKGWPFTLLIEAGKEEFGHYEDTLTITIANKSEVDGFLKKHNAVQHMLFEGKPKAAGKKPYKARDL